MRIEAPTLLALALSTACLAQVRVLPATDILTRPASYFDLEGRTLRYTPGAASGAYRVESRPLDWVTPSSPTTLAATGRTNSAYAVSWPVTLPFPFPFGGRSHTNMFVNANGNLSFGSPESANMPTHRDPWPDGTVRGMAASLDGRSLTTNESIIAALWQLYAGGNNARVQTERVGDRFVVTWDVERARAANSGYTPLGRNSFQVALSPNGQIEMSYQRVAERDGIVGLFPGGDPGAGLRIDNVARPDTQADPVVAVKNLELTDLGSALRWRFTMGAPTPTTIASGQLWYRVFLTLGGQNCEISLGYVPNVRTVMTCGSGALAYRNANGTVDLMVSKLALDGVTSFSWGADAVWFGFAGRFDQVNLQTRRPVQLSPAQINPEVNLSELLTPQDRSGNIFEIFHYPVVSKNLTVAPRAAYRRFAPEDDMFVGMLDFRPDDLFNHGPSTGQIAAGPQVTGLGLASNNGDFGSRRLQVAISPIWVQGQRMAEWVSDARREYFNYAQAIGWIAHELTHRWTAFLSFRSGGTNVSLNDGAHWLPQVNVPAVNRIWSDYSFSEYAERSLMDGGLYDEIGPGRFRMRELTYIIPAGFTGLDLYAMGFVPPEQMPGTYLIRNRTATGTPGEFTGEKIPVEGTDVVAAMGARGPSASNAQKTFKLGFYLFHDPSAGGPNPEALRDTQQIALQLAHFFSRATGGRMTMELNTPIDVPLPKVTGVANPLAPHGPLAPLNVLLLSGEALAAKQTAPRNGQFVSQWNGTSVTVGGRPALLRQVSPQSLEVLLPEAAEGDSALVVTTRRGSSEALPLKVAAAGTLYLLADGEGRADASRAEGGAVTGEAPATEGELIQIAVTGLKTNPAFAPGDNIPAETPVEVPATVMFGDIEAPVESAAMAPGLAGKILLRVKVPAGLTAGDLALRVVSGGASTNAASLPVAGAAGQ